MRRGAELDCLARRHEAAREILDRYIRDGAKQEVNLPHSIKREVLATYDAMDGGEPSETLLSAAEQV